MRRLEIIAEIKDTIGSDLFSFKWIISLSEKGN
jgi:hypothetical protein